MHALYFDASRSLEKNIVGKRLAATASIDTLTQSKRRMASQPCKDLAYNQGTGYIEITSRLVSMYDFFARVVKDCKRTSERSKRVSFAIIPNISFAPFPKAAPRLQT